jgi:hypothetical protein
MAQLLFMVIGASRGPRLGRVQADGALLRDGNLAGTGYLIQTRRNAWDLVSDTGRAVANRDVWLSAVATGCGCSWIGTRRLPAAAAA